MIFALLIKEPLRTKHGNTLNKERNYQHNAHNRKAMRRRRRQREQGNNGGK